MTPTPIPEVGTPAWHADRKKGIGGSEIAAVLGLSPWKSPLAVYNEKVGNTEPEEAGEAAMWGTILEHVIAPVAAEKIGEYRKAETKVRRRRQSYVHPDYSWMRCNIDRLIEGTDELLEIKTAGAYMKRLEDWGPSFSDEVPRQYMLQVQHQLVVTGRSGAWLAVLFGGQELRLYYIEPHADLQAFLIEQERRFWEWHVEAKVPPTVENGWKASAEDIATDLANAYAGGKGVIDAASEPDVLTLADELHHAIYDAAQAEERAKSLKNTMRERMGDNSVVELPGDERINWKRSKDKADKVDYEASFEDLAQQALANEWMTQTDLDAIPEDHTTEGGQGNRPFLTPKPWTKEDTDGELESSEDPSAQ